MPDLVEGLWEKDVVRNAYGKLGKLEQAPPTPEPTTAGEAPRFQWAWDQVAKLQKGIRSDALTQSAREAAVVRQHQVESGTWEGYKEEAFEKYKKDFGEDLDQDAWQSEHRLWRMANEFVSQTGLGSSESIVGRIPTKDRERFMDMVASLGQEYGRHRDLPEGWLGRPVRLGLRAFAHAGQEMFGELTTFLATKFTDAEQAEQIQLDRKDYLKAKGVLDAVDPLTPLSKRVKRVGAGTPLMQLLYDWKIPDVVRNAYEREGWAGVSDVIGEYADMGSAGAARMAPAMVGGMGMTAKLGRLGGVGFWLALSQPDIYRYLREEGKVSHEGATIGSHVIALPYAIVGQLQMEGVANMSKPLLNKARSAGIKSALELMGRFGYTWIAQTAEEGFQEAIKWVGLNTVAALEGKLSEVDQWKTLNDALESVGQAAISMPFLLAPGAIASAMQDFRAGPEGEQRPLRHLFLPRSMMVEREQDMVRGLIADSSTGIDVDPLKSLNNRDFLLSPEGAELFTDIYDEQALMLTDVDVPSRTYLQRAAPENLPLHRILTNERDREEFASMLRGVAETRAEPFAEEPTGLVAEEPGLEVEPELTEEESLALLAEQEEEALYAVPEEEAPPTVEPEPAEEPAEARQLLEPGKSKGLDLPVVDRTDVFEFDEESGKDILVESDVVEIDPEDPRLMRGRTPNKVRVKQMLEDPELRKARISLGITKDGNLQVIDGHHRLEASRRKGEKVEAIISYDNRPDAPAVKAKAEEPAKPPKQRMKAKAKPAKKKKAPPHANGRHRPSGLGDWSKLPGVKEAAEGSRQGQIFFANMHGIRMLMTGDGYLWFEWSDGTIADNLIESKTDQRWPAGELLKFMAETKATFVGIEPHQLTSAEFLAHRAGELDLAEQVEKIVKEMDQIWGPSGHPDRKRLGEILKRYRADEDSFEGSILAEHREAIMFALSAGKSISPEVLADYPDLKPPTKPAAKAKPPKKAEEPPIEEKAEEPAEPPKKRMKAKPKPAAKAEPPKKKRMKARRRADLAVNIKVRKGGADTPTAKEMRKVLAFGDVDAMREELPQLYPEMDPVGFEKASDEQIRDLYQEREAREREEEQARKEKEADALRQRKKRAAAKKKKAEKAEEEKAPTKLTPKERVQLETDLGKLMAPRGAIDRYLGSKFGGVSVDLREDARQNAGIRIFNIVAEGKVKPENLEALFKEQARREMLDILKHRKRLDQPTENIAEVADESKHQNWSGMPVNDPLNPHYQDERHVYRVDVPAGRVTSAPKAIKAIANVARAFGDRTVLRIGGLSGEKRPDKSGKLRKGLRGAFIENTLVARIRDAQDYIAAAHEFGHAIYQIAVTSEYFRGKVYDEVVKIGRDLYPEARSKIYLNKEGFADLFQMLVTRPEEAQRLAPNAFRAMNALIDGQKGARKALTKAQLEVATWQKMTPTQRGAKRMVNPATWGYLIKQVVAKITPRNFIQAHIEMADPIHYLTKRAEKELGKPLELGKSPWAILKYVRKGASGIVGYMIENGPVDVMGNVLDSDAALIKVKGLIREKEFVHWMVYLLAKRNFALWNDPNGPRNGGMPLVDANYIIDEIENGYPNRAARFSRAQSIVIRWNRGVRNYASSVSRDIADQNVLIDKVDPGDYLPLMREFMEGELKFHNSIAQLGTSARHARISARLKGSGRRVLHPIITMQQNAHKIVRASQQRLVLEAAARLALLPNMGDLILPIDVGKHGWTAKDVKRLQDGMDNMVENALDEMRGGVEKDEQTRWQEITGKHERETVTQMATFYQGIFDVNGKNVFSMTIDGKIRFFEIRGDILKGLETVGTVARLPGIWEWLVGKTTRFFKAGTTGFFLPFQALGNPQKDVPQGWINSQTKGMAARVFAGSLANYVTGFAHVLTGGKISTKQYRAWRDHSKKLMVDMARRHGTDVFVDASIARKLAQDWKVTLIDPRNYWDAFVELISTPELAPRMAEMKVLAKEIGYTPGDSLDFDTAIRLGIAGREATTDFSAEGSVGRYINQIIPYYNSPIQGIRAYFRALRRNPVGVMMRTGLIALIGLYLWRDNKDEEWYQKLTGRERFYYWFIRVGDRIVQIPKPHEAGAVASLLEATADAAYHEKTEGFVEQIEEMLDMVPVPVYRPSDLLRLKLNQPRGGLPVMGRLMIEQYANKKLWWDRPIVYDPTAPAPEQFNEFTTTAAIKLGEIFGWSPQRIDHFINTTAGRTWVGLIGALGGKGEGGRGGAARLALDKLGITEEDASLLAKQEIELADYPVIGQIFRKMGKLGIYNKDMRDLEIVLDDAVTRSKSFRDPETEREKEMRLMLQDAHRSYRALTFVRSRTVTVADRRRLQRTAFSIAADAMARYRDKDPTRVGKDHLKQYQALKAVVAYKSTGRIKGDTSAKLKALLTRRLDREVIDGKREEYGAYRTRQRIWRTQAIATLKAILDRDVTKADLVKLILNEERGGNKSSSQQRTNNRHIYQLEKYLDKLQGRR